jgi:hypothetical protein
LHTEGLNDAERAALATAYTALMTDLLLDELGVVGEVVVDGPLAHNKLFAPLLATFRTTNRISLSVGTGGCANAASHLAGFPHVNQFPLRTATPFSRTVEIRSLRDYRTAWREMLNK